MRKKIRDDYWKKKANWSLFLKIRRFTESGKKRNVTRGNFKDEKKSGSRLDFVGGFANKIVAAQCRARPRGIASKCEILKLRGSNNHAIFIFSEYCIRMFFFLHMFIY